VQWVYVCSKRTKIESERGRTCVRERVKEQINEGERVATTGMTSSQPARIEAPAS
jgi:hypothetical protein